MALQSLLKVQNPDCSAGRYCSKRDACTDDGGKPKRGMDAGPCSGLRLKRPCLHPRSSSRLHRDI
jgi:hypothetical protein